VGAGGSFSAAQTGAAIKRHAARKTMIRPRIADGHRVALIDDNIVRSLEGGKPAYFGLADGLNDGKETVGAFSAPAALVKYAFGANPTSPAYNTVGKDLTITL
jgi:hypothetical protein